MHEGAICGENSIRLYSNGDIYEGSFKMGKREGPGIYYNSQNQVFRTNFSEGIPNGEC
jgi:hypothetical protein